MGRGWRVRSVQPEDARSNVLGFANRRVRSLAGPSHPITHPGEQRGGKFDWTQWHVRSIESLSGTSLDSDRMLALSCPVVAWSASDHTLTKSVTFYDRWKSNEQNSKRDMWRASREVTLM
jgi:hypothetical protein